MEHTQHLPPMSRTGLQSGLFSADALSCPFVVHGVMEQWPSRKWTVDTLAQALGDRSFRCRLMQRERGERGGPAWEAEGVYVECQLRQFSAWSRGEASPDNPLAPFSPCHFSGYIDYKYMSGVFADQPHMLKDVHWSTLGLVGRDGQDSTLWIGSSGASTPCHYDTYGFNLVAQVQGRKRWVLFPPEEGCNLYPTRIPYEESSVFSLVDLASPDLVRFPHFKNSRPIVITLEAGQVLYVPRHWWHYVTCTETAVSINTWVEVPEDRESRVQESVTRLLASSLIPYLSHAVGSDVEDFWVNPTEELEEAGCNVQYLKVALTSVTTSLTAAVDATPPDQDHQPQSDHKRCSPVPKNPEGSTDEEKKGQTIEETCGQMGGGTERQINKEAIGEIIEKAEGQRSRQTITQTAACFGATEISSVPYQSPGEATNTPNTLRTKQNDVESQMTADPKKREKNVDGVFSLLNHVARALKDATVYTVDSPFSLSASQARPLQTVSLPCPRGHGDSVQETEMQDRSAVSLKRKCVDSENEDTGETQGDKASRFQSMSSSKLYKAVDGTDVHGQKRMCRREKKESTSVSSVSQCFVETEESEAQVCSEPPQTPGSLISVYAPQPCHLQQYIRLLQEGDSTVSSELGTEKDEKEENDGERDEEVENSDERDRREENDDEKDEKENEDKEDELSNSSCLASDSSTCHPAPAVEEAVLRSVLHPDVVTLIISKLKEQVR